jgi:hypothetical protein
MSMIGVSSLLFLRPLLDPVRDPIVLLAVGAGAAPARGTASDLDTALATFLHYLTRRTAA